MAHEPQLLPFAWHGSQYSAFQIGPDLVRPGVGPGCWPSRANESKPSHKPQWALAKKEAASAAITIHSIPHVSTVLALLPGVPGQNPNASLVLLLQMYDQLARLRTEPACPTRAKHAPARWKYGSREPCTTTGVFEPPMLGNRRSFQSQFLHHRVTNECNVWFSNTSSQTFIITTMPCVPRKHQKPFLAASPLLGLAGLHI